MDVVVDVGDVSGEFLLSQEDAQNMIDFVVKQLTLSVAKNWELMAQKNLGASRAEYMRSIYVGDSGRYTGFIRLRGIFPNMIEQGAEPFDIKKGMFKSNKVKFTASGRRYITIPFRFSNPNAIGDNPVFSGQLPLVVYNIVKKKEQSMKTDLGKTLNQGVGLKDVELPKEWRIPEVRKRVSNTNQTFEEYKHKSSIFSGLKRSSKEYENATQGKYVTFRRISEAGEEGEGSDPNSWIHTGIVARKLAEKALQSTNIRFEVDRSTDKFLQELGF